MENCGPSRPNSSDQDGGTALNSDDVLRQLDELEPPLGDHSQEAEEMDVDDENIVEDYHDSDENDDEGTDKYSTELPPMRGYQLELAGAACKGTNTIVCAPTGSGKTRVATHIIQEHLNDDFYAVARKVVFLARTSPLVSQQYRTLEAWLPDRKVTHISGQTGNHDNLHLLLDDYDVLVMTPKILENHLGPEMIPSLAAFSLIVFDECHHTRKGEPYNSLMKAYFKSKADGEKNLPQIVGLTASVGVEKATSVGDAVSSIIELMANMDVKHISRVMNEDNLKELELIVPKPDEDMRRLKPRGKDSVSQDIQRAMTDIEGLLKEQFPTPLKDPELEKVKYCHQKQPSHRASQNYGQWARKMCSEANFVHIPKVPEKDVTESVIEKRRLFSQNVRLLAETLVVLNEALDVHELSRPKDVLDHVKKSLDPRHPADSPERLPLEDKLCRLLEDLQEKLRREKTSENPNLTRLAEVIEKRLRGNWEASRVMVFVPTRATCVALCGWLNSEAVSSDLQQLKAKPFTGSGAKQELGGMTQSDQEDVLDMFRAGEVRLLVCTSVGQEGMDIPDCNLVIRYNHVGNEVATVQTRGRCRKAGGISVLLAMPAVIQKEVVNCRLVAIMNKAIEEVVSKLDGDVKNRVSEAQKKNTATASRKRKHPGGLQKSQDSFILQCSGCRKVQLPGSSIRTINGCHHIIIGNDLEKTGEVEVKFLSKPSYVDGKHSVEFYGEIVCCKCPGTRPRVLGTLSKYQGIEFHAVKAKGWIVLDSDSNNRVIKTGNWKWGEIDELYAIAELTDEDINHHLGVEEDGETEDAGDAS